MCRILFIGSNYSFINRQAAINLLIIFIFFMGLGISKNLLTGKLVLDKEIDVSTNNPTSFLSQDDNEADLIIRKTVTPKTLLPGQLITYTLVYTNNGPSLATPVGILNNLPITLTNASYSSSGADITPVGSLKYAWEVEDLSPGEGGIITVTGIISPNLSVKTTWSEPVTIVSDTPDPNEANNEVVTKVTVELPAAVGGLVWADVNSDGIQNNSENGINNVDIKLYHDTDGDYIAEPDGDDHFVSAMVTSNNDAGNPGFYKFTNVLPGNYFLQFGKPEDYIFSPKDQSNNDSNDSDVTGNGLTEVFTLHSQNNISGWDAGIHVSSFLPLIASSPLLPPLPDLSINITDVTSNDVELSVVNQGIAPVKLEFWVDLYIDPDPIPTRPNQLCDISDPINNVDCNESLVWFVTVDALPLQPNEAIILTVSSPFYEGPGTVVFENGMELYAQVDTGNSSHGHIEEIDEVGGRTYNNIDHVTVSGLGN